MRVDAIEDVPTRRINKIKLEAQTFQDQMALTHLHNALMAGRHVRIEISDDEEYEFRLVEAKRKPKER